MKHKFSSEVLNQHAFQWLELHFILCLMYNLTPRQSPSSRALLSMLKNQAFSLEQGQMTVLLLQRFHPPFPTSIISECYICLQTLHMQPLMLQSSFNSKPSTTTAYNQVTS